MISILKGRLVERQQNAVVVDCGGIGYFVKTPSSVSSAIPGIGEEVLLYTKMFFSKEEITLVGFLDELQRKCFEQLSEVSGCGTKLCLSILSDLTPRQVYMAVSECDEASFSRVKGIGKRLAQRIILELSDKIKHIAQESTGTDGLEKNTGAVQTAVSALVSLGYKKKEAMTAVLKVDTSLSVEKIISNALAVI